MKPFSSWKGTGLPKIVTSDGRPRRRISSASIALTTFLAYNANGAIYAAPAIKR